MKNKSKIILIGGFHETIELCLACKKKIVGIIDNTLKNKYFGYDIIGSDADAHELYKKYGDIPIIISVDEPLRRKKLVNYYSQAGFTFTKLLHPGAFISLSTNIGKGVVIHNGVSISVNAVIDDHVRLNTFANIMHDSQIGKFTTVAPNAVVLGRVKINEMCYIGANSTILNDRTIHANTVIGAGAVVTKDIDKSGTYIGVPAKRII